MQMYKTGHQGKVLLNFKLFYIFAFVFYYTLCFILYFCAKEHLKIFCCDLEQQKGFCLAGKGTIRAHGVTCLTFLSFVNFLYFAGSVFLTVFPSVYTFWLFFLYFIISSLSIFQSFFLLLFNYLSFYTSK